MFSFLAGVPGARVQVEKCPWPQSSGECVVSCVNTSFLLTAWEGWCWCLRLPPLSPPTPAQAFPYSQLGRRRGQMEDGRT